MISFRSQTVKILGQKITTDLEIAERLHIMLIVEAVHLLVQVLN